MTRCATYLLIAGAALVTLPTPVLAQHSETASDAAAIKTLPSLSILEFKPAFRYIDPDSCPFTDRNIYFGTELPDIDGGRVIDAWSRSHLPATLYLTNGTCLLYSVNLGSYGPVSGRLEPSVCADRPANDRQMPSHPVPAGLRFVGSSWGMSAWVNKKDGTTVVTKPFAKTFAPLFTADFPVLAMMAIIDPHGVGAGITLIGPRRGKLVAVTVDVAVR
jgi:hypothetical protein